MNLLLFNLAVDTDDPVLGFTTHWIRSLAAKCEHIDVITMRAGNIDVPRNVSVVSLGKESGYSEPRRAGRFYRALWTALRTRRIDGCLSHMTPLFTVMAAPLLRLYGVPNLTWYAHPRLSLTLRLAHCLSHRVVTSLSTAYPYKKDRLVVVGQGIDTTLFGPGDRDEISPPVLLCVGRLAPIKDHETLLRAAAILKARTNTAFRVVLVGGTAVASDERYTRDLRYTAGSLGISDVLEFKGPLTQAQLPHWYRQCAVHVNMTRIGSGDKSVLEAMSCGRPSVTANEGFRETLGTYADDLLFPERDARALASRLDALLRRSKEERQAIGAVLRARVESMHGVDRLGNRLIELLRRGEGRVRPGQSRERLT